MKHCTSTELQRRAGDNYDRRTAIFTRAEGRELTSEELELHVSLLGESGQIWAELLRREALHA